MASYLISAAVACQASGATVSVRYTKAPDSEGVEHSTKQWHLFASDGSYDQRQPSPGIASTVVFTVPADGEYQLTLASAEETWGEQLVSVACNSTAPPALLLDSLTATDATATQRGSITAQASGGVAPLSFTVAQLNLKLTATAGQPLTLLDVPAGSYDCRFTDSVGQQVSGSVTVAALTETVRGCTDPLADNYNAAATQDDNSCTYSPPVLAPYFAVPLLQSLRFVLRDAGPERFENTLFCEQTRPGQQVRPYFYQLVEATDPVRVQVLSSYSSVSATIFQHGGSQVGPALALARVRTLDGEADPLAVVLRRDPDTGTTQLLLPAGGALPASLLAAPRVRLSGGAAGTYRVTQAVPGSVVALDDYLVLSRPWQDAAGALASWPLTGPGYNVFEATLPLGALPAGVYQVRLRATQAGWPAVLAESEPLQLATRHPGTVALDYRNADNCYGTAFFTGLTPRLRVPGTFFRGGNGGTLTTYRETAGRLTLLGSTATRLRKLETYGLPAWLHEKIFLACRLDFLSVDGVRCQTDQAYETSELRPYPLTGGSVVLEQVDALGTGNGDDVGVDETAPENALALRRGGYLLLRGR